MNKDAEEPVSVLPVGKWLSCVVQIHTHPISAAALKPWKWRRQTTLKNTRAEVRRTFGALMIPERSRWFTESV